MIVEHVQRWTERRASRRPAGELIRTAAYDVAAIASAAVARAFVARHHYSASVSSTAHRLGLYCRGDLVGVALFGPPASMAAHRAVFPTLTIREAVTLGRFVLLDAAPGNAESWFIARCFELLRAEGIAAVESCADPEPRTTASGDVVHRGHVGTIYCATNGRYVGKTNPSTLRLLPDGTCYSNRSAGKLAQGDVGRRYAAAQLERWGAEPLRDDEDALGWLRYWRARLTRPMRHGGNHRYLWCLDRRRRREVLTAPQRPYPKLDLCVAA
ncbi:MAG: hypothetical protein ACREBE_00020 [bacterium]